MMSKEPLDQDRFEDIEAYVLGTMDPSRRIRFELELGDNAALRAEVDMQRTNILAVELGGLDRLMKDLAAVKTERRNEHTTWRSYLGYAAAAALLLGVVTWLFMRPSAEERLYAAYYVADPGLPVAMGTTNHHAFHDAMVAYKLGDLREARDAWSALLRDNPHSDTLRYYIASADLALGDVRAAIPVLERLAAEPSTFATKARWYLLLAYVRIGDTERAATVDLDLDPVYGERVRAIKAAR